MASVRSSTPPQRHRDVDQVGIDARIEVPEVRVGNVMVAVADGQEMAAIVIELKTAAEMEHEVELR